MKSERHHVLAEPPGADTPVEQLLYRSRSRDGAASGLQMSDILAEARPANAREGITGVLTAVDGHFVQIIEGSDDALDRLVAKLRRDPRHSDLTILERRLANSRRFGDWDMVSPRLAPSEVALLALLLQDQQAGIEAYADVLDRAIATQEAVLEGRRSASDAPTMPQATADLAPGSKA